MRGSGSSEVTERHWWQICVWRLCLVSPRGGLAEHLVFAHGRLPHSVRRHSAEPLGILDGRSHAGVLSILEPPAAEWGERAHHPQAVVVRAVGRVRAQTSVVRASPGSACRAQSRLAAGRKARALALWQSCDGTRSGRITEFRSLVLEAPACDQASDVFGKESGSRVAAGGDPPHYRKSWDAARHATSPTPRLHRLRPHRRSTASCF